MERLEARTSYLLLVTRATLHKRSQWAAPEIRRPSPGLGGTETLFTLDFPKVPDKLPSGKHWLENSAFIRESLLSRPCPPGGARVHLEPRTTPGRHRGKGAPQDIETQYAAPETCLETVPSGSCSPLSQAFPQSQRAGDYSTLKAMRLCSGPLQAHPLQRQISNSPASRILFRTNKNKCHDVLLIFYEDTYFNVMSMSVCFY